MVDLKTRLASIPMTCDPNADNLAIALSTYFSTHPERPDNDPEDDNGWGEWVTDRCYEILIKIANEAQRNAS